MNWRRRFSNGFFRWIDKRTPRSLKVKLTHKNLYIVPNLSGLLYLMMTLVIWLLGTNYQNNLILALSYLMVSLFVVAIHHTFANMAGISVRFVSAKPAFAGEVATFVLELTTSHKRGCNHVEIRWQQGDAQTLNLVYMEPQQVNLRAPSHHRGYLHPGRLLIQSKFPLGIIRCWSWLNLEATTLIYPAPIVIDEPQHSASSGKEEGGNSTHSGDDFSGLRDYQAGDSIKHIAWKQFAQNKGLFTKEYEAHFSAEKWLDWHSLTQLQELRLSGLCYWALHYEHQQIPYGLKFPSLTLAPALGDHHLHNVLKTLAQFNIAQNNPTPEASHVAQAPV